MSESINWDEMLSGSFIQIEEGKPKTLVLKNWRPQTKFKDDKTGEIRPGIVFDVLGEDDKVYDENTKKEYTVTAKGAMSGLKPIIVNAEQSGADSIKVSIVAVGKGTQRKYSISPVE